MGNKNKHKVKFFDHAAQDVIRDVTQFDDKQVQLALLRSNEKVTAVCPSLKWTYGKEAKSLHQHRLLFVQHHCETGFSDGLGFLVGLLGLWLIPNPYVKLTCASLALFTGTKMVAKGKKMSDELAKLENLERLLQKYKHRNAIRR